MGNKLYWIGKYESDIIGNYFDGSITYYGNNQNNNYAFCKINERIDASLRANFLNFVGNTMEHIIRKNPLAKFMFYSQSWAYTVIESKPIMVDYIICLNDKTTISLLNDKTRTKLWVSNFCKIPPFILAVKDKCTFNNLTNEFPNSNEFIIQENKSSGGTGTFVVTKNNNQYVQSELSNTLFIASPRLKNSYSINTHICIFKNDIVVFPSSIQIIIEKNNRLLYMGADYISIKSISNHIRNSIKEVCIFIANEIKKLGYLGFLGIDLMVDSNDEILFVEINPRFQGSTMLLNSNLVKSGLKSVYELNSDAFNNKEINKSPYENVSINNSFAYFKNFDNYESYKLLHSKFLDNNEYSILDDGYNGDIYPHLNAYLYRVIFNRNISCINSNNELNIVENIINQRIFSLPINSANDMINLKISLLVQGLTIEKEALLYICKDSTIKEATFNAIDITIFNCLKVNVPVKIPFVDISPFSIKYNKLNGLCLYYFNSFISKVIIDIEDKLPKETSNHKIPYNAIAFRTNDRVRIRHNSFCYFKENGKSCGFCENKKKNHYELILDDIFEVIDNYEEKVDFRHYLIGGGSGNPKSEYKKIAKIAAYIKDKYNKPIYVMALPPDNIEAIKLYYESGVTEVAFNLEIFDRKIANSVMPGKGNIPLEKYIEMLTESVKYFGKSGNVRSMLIIGFEPDDSLLDGVKLLASIGVSPMLSALRPMPNSKFRDYISDNVKHISELFFKAKAICDEHNICLGPSCEECQNNTITLPQRYFDYLL